MAAPSPDLHRPWLDLMGVAVSVTCAVHCAASGLFFALLPWLGVAGAEQPWLEWAFLGTAITVGTASLRAGWTRHRRGAPGVAFAAGLALLIAARAVAERVEDIEPALVVVGAALVSTAHLLNWRSVVTCRACAPTP